jgi:hypothetical protein
MLTGERTGKGCASKEIVVTVAGVFVAVVGFGALECSRMVGNSHSCLFAFFYLFRIH